LHADYIKFGFKEGDSFRAGRLPLKWEGEQIIVITKPPPFKATLYTHLYPARQDVTCEHHIKFFKSSDKCD